MFCLFPLFGSCRLLLDRLAKAVHGIVRFRQGGVGYCLAQQLICLDPFLSRNEIFDPGDNSFLIPSLPFFLLGFKLQRLFLFLEVFAKLQDSLVLCVQKAIVERACQQLGCLFNSVLSKQLTHLVETPFDVGFDRLFSFPLVPFTELRLTPSSVDI